MDAVAKRIFKLLDEKDMEQKKFAEAIGTTDKVVSKWRTSGLKSYRKYLPEIAAVLDTTVDYLLNGDNAAVTMLDWLPPQESMQDLLELAEVKSKMTLSSLKEFIEDSSISDTKNCWMNVEINVYTPGSKQKPVILANDGLSPTEQALMDLFRRLTPEQQELVVGMVQAAADKQRSLQAPPTSGRPGHSPPE